MTFQDLALLCSLIGNVWLFGSLWLLHTKHEAKAKALNKMYARQAPEDPWDYIQETLDSSIPSVLDPTVEIPATPRAWEKPNPMLQTEGLSCEQKAFIKRHEELHAEFRDQYVVEPDTCPHCGSRNWIEFDAQQYECHDCGQTFAWPQPEPEHTDHQRRFADNAHGVFKDRTQAALLLVFVTATIVALTLKVLGE